MDESTAVPLNDLEVDNEENDFDIGWTDLDNNNEEKPMVIHCLHVHYIS